LQRLGECSEELFPCAEQRECFYHLVKNFQKRFRGFHQIYPTARAYKAEIFYDHLAKMVSESSEVVQWLHYWKLEYFCE
jgi:hypothetical protein